MMSGCVVVLLNTEREFMIKIGLDAQVRKTVVARLQLLLANEYVVYTKTLKFHWNVYGKHFAAMHAFFKEQYEAMLTITDDVAERVRALDAMSLGTLAEFLKHTTLKEEPGINPDDLGMVAALLHDHEHIITQLRADIDETARLGDMGTNNFLTELMEKHEKMAWMLRAFLQQSGE